MRQVCLGAERQRGAIVSVVFDQVGIVFGKLRRFEIVGLGEELCRSDDGVNLSF